MAETAAPEANKPEHPPRDSPVKNNPFETYKNTNPPHDEHPPKPKARSPSSHNNSPGSQSRSRSREGRPREREREPRQASPTYQRRRSHERTSRTQNLAPRGKVEGPPQQAYFKTKLCPLFDKGQCKKGSTCNFAHGDKELRGLPNFRKTRLCIPFKNGECPKSSEDCKYAHGEAELRKLAYDYVPSKGPSPAQRTDRGDRYERSDRVDRYDRGDRYEREKPRKFRDDGFQRDNRIRNKRDFRDQRQEEFYRGPRRDIPPEPHDYQGQNRSHQRDSSERNQRESTREPYGRGGFPMGAQFGPYGYMTMHNNPYMVGPPMGGFGGGGGEMFGAGGGPMGGTSFPGLYPGGGSYPYGYGYGAQGYSSYGGSV